MRNAIAVQVLFGSSLNLIIFSRSTVLLFLELQAVVTLAISSCGDIDQAPLHQTAERNFDLSNSLPHSAFVQPPIGNSVDRISRFRVCEQIPQNLIRKRIARIGRQSFHGIVQKVVSSSDATSKQHIFQYKGGVAWTKKSGYIHTSIRIHISFAWYRGQDGFVLSPRAFVLARSQPPNGGQGIKGLWRMGNER